MTSRAQALKLTCRSSRSRARRLNAINGGIESVADAPPELVALFGQFDHVPFWVDRERVNCTVVPVQRGLGAWPGRRVPATGLAQGG